MNGDPAVQGLTALVFMKLESERVPRKNLRLVAEEPLFYWVFDALLRSRYVERIILNTDSRLIADEVTARFDVVVHLRPDHLLSITSDEANKIMAHDLSLDPGEFFLQTHSTNPLLKVETLDRAVEVFFQDALPGGFDSLFSVTCHKKRFFFADGQPVNHDPSHLRKTQELSPLLEENSCIYVFSRSSFERNAMNRIGRNPYLLEIPAEEALDIDTEDDLALADKLLRFGGSQRE